MDRIFERRFEKAANPRTRKRNGKKPRKFVRAKSNVEAVLHDMMADDPDMPRDSERICHPNPVVMGSRVAEGILAPVVVARNLALAAGMDAAEAVKRRMTRKARMAKLEKRRSYYAAENALRAKQREAIRLARPAPKNPCPTAAALTEAYRRRRESDECLLRFGELMIDLEEHARRKFAFAGNRFAGSAGGMRDWLKANCPLLAAHYSTCQRYKRLAQEDSATHVNG